MLKQAFIKKLSTVYNELLKYNKTDNEIYFIRASSFPINKENYKFINIYCNFKSACLIGFLDKENDQLIINPLVNDNYIDYTIKPDDELVFIAKIKEI